jgi:hypothetical protein
MSVDMVTLARAADWEALYYNDELVMEDHTIDTASAIEYIADQGTVFNFRVLDDDEVTEYVDEQGEFPGSLSTLLEAV